MNPSGRQWRHTWLWPPHLSPLTGARAVVIVAPGYPAQS